MVFQEKEGSIWEAHQTQIFPVRPWRHTEMGGELLGYLPPVVNWMSVRATITLIILRELHIKSVDFVLAYTQYDVK